MSTAYFDCFSGISGDMVLGALIDLGFPPATLNASLAYLKLPPHRTEVSVEERLGLRGTRFSVVLEKPEKKPNTFKDIRALIKNSRLETIVKERSIAIFEKLAKTEAHIHQKKVDAVHFHEVGGTDSIIDIVGSVLGISYLGIKKIIASPLPLGTGGWVKSSHGNLPLPAPAALEVLLGVPVYGTDRAGELVTPTGAAIIATMADSFGPLPFFRLEKVGYGVGSRNDPDLPNLLRVIVGAAEKSIRTELAAVIETNIDNMNPEIYGYLMDVLFEKGALDVSLVPVQMKKNRPGVILKVIAHEKDKPLLIKAIFQETAAIGLRSYTVERYVLPRQVKKIKTPWGEVRIKISEGPDGAQEIAPEYEDCKKIARNQNIPLKRVLSGVYRLIKS